jgi:hypothetical protein
VENFQPLPLDNIVLRTTFALPFEKQHSSLSNSKGTQRSDYAFNQKSISKKFLENLEM